MIEKVIVGKFGGTSMATAEHVMRSAEIVRAEDMRAVVVSAPGKREATDTKVTDLLLACDAMIREGRSFHEPFDRIAERFEDIGRGLKVHQSVVSWLSAVRTTMTQGADRDWIAAQGEIGMARILAEYMGGAFRDAQALIRLKDNKQIDPLTYQIVREQLQPQNVLHVIPGFYGATATGAILTFDRGGSDITGAIIARGLAASEYQNWTDVDGVKAADPRVVFDARSISQMTFREMRELSYRGAGVLQVDAVLPVAEVGIPVVVRNTFNPSHEGTRIVPQRQSEPGELIVGLAGREGFTSIQIGKNGMNAERGVAAKILECFEQHGVSVEHDPTGIDTMSVIAHRDQLSGKTDEIIARIKETVHPDDVAVIQGIGLVCVVGQEISRKSTKIVATLAGGLENRGVNITSITYPTHGNSIIIGVRETDTQEAIKASYDALLRN